MFERDCELKALDEALTGLCRARTGGLLSFAAPTGLGKTALLAEARRRALARGCTVLSGCGAEREHQLAFHVVRQLVQPLLATMEEDEQRRMLGSWYDILAPALGLVAADSGTAPDPQGVRDGLDWIVTRFVVRRAPVVMLLDDAHWVDAESLAWLSSFAPRAAELPILLVLAYRSEGAPLHGAGPLRGLVGRHGVRPHELKALTPNAVARIVRDTLGASTDDAFCRECWAITGGSPFEVVELTARFRDQGLKPQRENLVQLRELASAVKGSGLAASLDRLGPTAVRLAWATAVLGTGAPWEPAVRVAALDERTAAEACDRLIGARILAPASSRNGPLEFCHPLIATAVYQAIPAAMRVALHGQAAAAVANAGGAVTAAARHLLETHPEADPQVVAVLRRAAREYLRSGAPDAAHRCLARALREPPPPADRAQILYELGCSSSLTEPAVTVNHLRAALEEPELSADLREAITCRLAQALGHSGRMAEAARVVAEEAGRATHARTKLRMQAEQLVWNALRSDEPDAPARSRRLARLAGHLTGRGMAERYILGLRAWDALVRGESSATVLAHAEEALGDGLSWTDENWGFEVPVLVALTFLYCDRPGRAEELFSRGIAECERKGWRGAHLALGLSYLGYVRYRRGRLAEAEDLAREGLRIADRVGTGAPAQWAALGTLITVLLARGNVSAARETAERYHYGDVLPSAVVHPDAQEVHAELQLALGERTEAERQLSLLGSRLESRGIRNPAWCPWQLRLARTVAPAEPDRAAELAAEAVRRSRRFGTPGAIGRALYHAAAAAEGDQRLQLLSDAVDQLERSPAGLDLAWALADHGTALRRSGRPQEAAEPLYRALESATLCGADALALRIRGEMAATGLRPLQLTGDDTHLLTAREHTVADHAVRGWSEERIAEELHTDVRTVVRLLSAVYRKLGSDRAGLSRQLDGPGARSVPGT